MKYTRLFFLGILISVMVIFGVALISNRNNNIPFSVNPYKVISEFYTNELADVKAQKQIKVILGGDVMLGRSVEQTSLSQNNFNYPFMAVSDYLNSADLVFVNLENPIIDNCPPHTSGLVFCANPRMLSGLQFANIALVNLANNHTLNYGQSGFIKTKSTLDQLGISYTGDNNLVVKQINGAKFGFLGFNRAESNYSLTDEELNLVSSSDKQVDVLIVAMHWGNEYKPIANSFQRETTRKLVENGADVVVGHHPHWIQDREIINDKPVYYSLGNFVFDQMWSEKTRQGMLVELTFIGNKVVSEKFVDIYIDKLGQPIITN